MKSFLSRYSNSLVLAMVIFGQLLGLAVQIKRQGEEGQTRLLRVWVIGAIAPIEKGVVHTHGWVSSTWTNYLNVREVRRQNELLKDQVEQMRLQQVRLQEDANQARRIQSLLAFKEQFISRTIAAQVIGTSGSESSRLIYIDRGSDDGIRPNLPVITPEGVVGKVLRVYGSTSQVLEISDQTSGVGAILVNSRLQGIVKGNASGELTLNYIMADEKVEAGDQLVTSGGDQIFPKGLPIGKIDSVSLGRDSFLNLRVRPSANLSRLEEVLVITDVELKEPDTKDLGPIRASDILAQRLPSVPDKPDPNAPKTEGSQGPQGSPTGGQSTAVPAQGAANQPGAAKPVVPNTTGVANTSAGGAATKPAGTSPQSVKPSASAGGNGAPAPASKPATKPASANESKPKTVTGTGTPSKAKLTSGTAGASESKPKPEIKPSAKPPATDAADPQGH